MATAIPPRSVAIAAKVDDHAWRGRTLLAGGILALGVIGLGAVNLDWSDGPAVALAQLAGMVTPIAGLGALVWSAAALAGRKR